ncbi:MAG: adenylate kinase [Zetaproteobacteria bacterium]|nr:adenylate kinase [Zetaproteobacteria bacterium]
MKNLLLFGPPGVGKGTQGEHLCRDLGLVQLAMGDILREAVANETSLGLEAKAFMEQGKLVPDSLVVGMIQSRILSLECEQGFILDGFPRNVAQAEILDKMLLDNSIQLDFIVFMDAAEDTLLARLTGRMLCSSCGFGFHRHYSPPSVEGVCDKCSGELYQRKDDREEVISERLEVYKQQTKPLLDYYGAREAFIKVDASADTKEVYSVLLNLVNA